MYEGREEEPLEELNNECKILERFIVSFGRRKLKRKLFTALPLEITVNIKKLTKMDNF